jgi:hypothetical protein
MDALSPELKFNQKQEYQFLIKFGQYIAKIL